jgi:hypothetical protein
MKLQQLAFPALAALLSLLVGCAPDRSHKINGSAGYREAEAMYYRGRSSFFFLNSRGPFDPPDQWCRTANDQNLSLDGRRVAAAILFAAYVKPGFNTDDMRKAIPDNRWLDACSVEAVSLIGGGFPLLYFDNPFTLRLFPGDDKKWWTIWFSLHKSGQTPFEQLDALSFLKGVHPDKSIRIEEFVIQFPFPTVPYVEVQETVVGGITNVAYLPHPTFPAAQVEERHSRTGIGIKILPNAWYEDASPYLPPLKRVTNGLTCFALQLTNGPLVEVSIFRHRQSPTLERAFQKEAESVAETEEMVQKQIQEARRESIKTNFESFLKEIQTGEAFPRPTKLQDWPVILPKQLLFEKEEPNVMVIFARYQRKPADLAFIVQSKGWLEAKARAEVVDKLTKCITAYSESDWKNVPESRTPLFDDEGQVAAPEVQEWLKKTTFLKQ